MDFNDIQSAWNSDKSENVSLPANLEKLQSTNMPLDKIRKNLKNEFIYQIISIVFLGFIPFIFKFSPLMQTGFYGLYVLFLMICAYFLVKLYFFYKRLNTVSMTTKDNLYETYYDIRLNMEFYKSFCYSLVPFIIAFQVLIYVNLYKLDQFTDLLNEKSDDIFIGFLIGAFVGATAAIAFVTEWWVNHFYGKYAKEIRKVLDELKE
ncbi:hypothetical protein NAT51_00160 [Flavobacterium amniphilum]|uniref:hypothetical protein n=1 Tax=Flavobacterium amniphilum TaxID=1834035 RepID=UPI002029C36D|nr:hypothetical protein [Flavobacterium amniphilum]MCL9803916.1 hypothetical protein [Flavobacterium amniphilum]